MGRNPFDFGEDPTMARPSPPPSPPPSSAGPFGFAGPGAPAGEPPGPPRRRRVPRAALVVGLCAVLLAGIVTVVLTSHPGTGDPGAPAAPAAPAPTAAPTAAAPAAGGTANGDTASGGGGLVTYEVSGTGSASSVRFSGDAARDDGEVLAPALPFRTTVGAAPAPAVFTVVATPGPGDGTLSCRVTRDGRVLDERTAGGRGADVTCSGS